MKLSNFIDNLKKKDVELCDIYFLIEQIFNINKEYICFNFDFELNDKLVNDILKQIDIGKPIPYITSKVVFNELTILLNENCLIPRIETEELTSIVINENKLLKDKQINILDLCSGSGCIGLSLANYFKNSIVYCSDIQAECLEISKGSAKINNINNVTFIKSNYLDEIINMNIKFDIVVSNPPYIPENKKTDTLLEKDICLFSGKDGLDSYKEIFSKLDYVCKIGTKIYFECEADNMCNLIKLVENKLSDNYFYKVIQDMSKKDRFLYLEKK